MARASYPTVEIDDANSRDSLLSQSIRFSKRTARRKAVVTHRPNRLRRRDASTCNPADIAHRVFSFDLYNKQK